MAELVMRTWSSGSANACTEEAGEVPIQRLADPGQDPASAFETDSAVASRLTARRGGGQPLPPAVRNRMEAGFGADFSEVRIHRDAEASDLSAGLAARTFTHGTDIYFGMGTYDPATRSGQHLLAHELAHTLQQGAVVARQLCSPVPHLMGSPRSSQQPTARVPVLQRSYMRWEQLPNPHWATVEDANLEYLTLSAEVEVNAALADIKGLWKSRNKEVLTATIKRLIGGAISGTTRAIVEEAIGKSPQPNREWRFRDREEAARSAR